MTGLEIKKEKQSSYIARRGESYGIPILTKLSVLQIYGQTFFVFNIVKQNAHITWSNRAIYNVMVKIVNAKCMCKVFSKTWAKFFYVHVVNSIL